MNNIEYNNRKALAAFVRTSPHEFHMYSAFVNNAKPNSRACIGAMAAVLWPEVVESRNGTNPTVVTWNGPRLALKLGCHVEDISSITHPDWIEHVEVNDTSLMDRERAATMLDNFAEHDEVNWG